MRSRLPAVLLACFALTPAGHALAQEGSARTPDPQVELNVVNLPTTQSLGRHQSYMRITHRFVRDLRLGDFSELAADLFSLDNGAVVGLEYRFGVTATLHGGVHRNTDSKTLQFFGRWDAVHQGRLPFGVSVLASIEGLDNLQTGRQPAIGGVLSFTRGRALALYLSPVFVDGTREAGEVTGLGHEHDHFPLMDEPAGRHEGDGHASHEGTSYIGLGARARLLNTVFIAAEISPRVNGHDPGDDAWAVSLEKVTRGHTLALTLTNTFATTPGQIARGGTDALYLGFNLTRRF